MYKSLFVILTISGALACVAVANETTNPMGEQDSVVIDDMDTFDNSAMPQDQQGMIDRSDAGDQLPADLTMAGASPNPNAN